MRTRGLRIEDLLFAGCLRWPLRFALYVVSAALGIGWLTVIGA